MSPNLAKRVAALAALAAAVGVTALNGGGFDARSQAIFVALAGVALLAASLLDGQAVSIAARSSLALALAGFAALSLASVAWTVDGRTTALRTGLVVGGYAAVFVSAGTLARRTGALPFAAAIAVLALVEAVLGLGAVAMHSLPDAERIYGVWRPGGTFQYPPALAILEVCALPAVSSLMNHRSSLVAGGAAAAASLAGAALGLSGSALGLAMAALLLAIMIVWPMDGRTGRTAAIAAAALVAIGALLAPEVLGGHVSATAPGAGWSGAGEIAGIAAALGLAWRLTRRARALLNRPLLVAIACVATVALASLAWASHQDPIATPTAPDVRRSYTPARHGDFLHGRGQEWRAALQTSLDRPLLGAGAGAYSAASLTHQGRAPTPYAHDLPLEMTAELGVLGLLLGLAVYAASAQLVSRSVNTAGFWLLAPTVVAFLASNLLDWTWHLAGLTALWAAATGALHGSAGNR